MENLDNGLTVPKWVMIVWPKMPQNLAAQFVCPNPKVLYLNGKRLHWAFVVRGNKHPSDPGLRVLSEEMLLMTAFDDHSCLLPYTQLHSHRVRTK